MAYQINKTDGTIVATVADGQVDQLSTDLTLIGKNYSGFGEALNENFIKLLENFSSTAQPTNPIRGQLWFDTRELKLKIYSGTQFIPVSSATIANTQPTTLGVGDLWFNNVDKQLYFYDGSNTILLGPDYSVSQGISGLRVVSILDTLNQTRVITLLYNNGILLGIFSKDSFTPKTEIQGYGPQSKTIIPGFNAGSLSGIKFAVTCTNSESLGGAVATTYVRKDSSNAINGQLRITTDLGIEVGSAGQGSFTVDSGNVVIANSSSNRNFRLTVRKDASQETVMDVSAASRIVDIYPGFSDSELRLGGSLTVQGDLTVQGTTTTINTANITVEDKSIVLAKQTGVVPTDSNASGGGIVLQGDTAHTFVWSLTNEPLSGNSADAISGGYNDYFPALLSTAWNSSDHINLASGKYFAINGVPVLTGNSLGAGITSIPGVTSFGPQVIVDIGPDGVTTPGAPAANVEMRLRNNKISTTKGNLDLELEPNGTGNVSLIGSPKIVGLSTTNESTPAIENLSSADLTEATNKLYVTKLVRTRPIILSVDISDGKLISYIINQILNRMAPVSEFEEGSEARVLCNTLINAPVNISPVANISTDTFSQPGGGQAPAVTAVAIPTISVPSQPTTNVRIIRIFRITAGVWVHQPASDVLLPS